MALRDLLAVFDIQINDSPLIAANIKLDAFEVHLGEVAALANALGATQITPPGVALPTLGPIAAPEVGAPQFGPVAAPVVGSTTLDGAPALAELARIQAEAGSLRAALGVPVGVEISAGPARTALESLDAEAARLQGTLATAAELDTTRATGQINSLTARLAALGDVKTRDPEALAKIEKEAIEVQAALTRIAAVDATNPSLPALQSQLTAVRTAAKPPAPLPTSNLQGFGGALAKVSGLAAGFGLALGTQQLIAFGSAVTDKAGVLADLSAGLSISTDDLQIFDAWLTQSGASAEELPLALKSVSAALQPGASKEQAAALRELGISASDAAGMTTDLGASFVDIAGRLGDVKDPAQQMVLAQKLLGRGVLAMLPAFKGGTAAIQEQISALSEMGVVMGEDAIDALDTFGDKAGLAKMQLQVLASKGLTLLLPLLTRVIEVGGKFSSWLQKNVSLSGVARVATVAMGVGVSTLLGPLTGAGGLLGRMAGWFPRIGSLALGAARVLYRFVLPFLVLEDVFGFLQGKDSVLGDIINGLFGVGSAGEVLQMVTDLASGFGDALSAVWDTMTGNPMTETTGEITAGIAAWQNALSDFAFFFEDIWNRIKSYAVGAIGGLSTSLGGFVSKIPGLGAAGEALSSFGQETQASADGMLKRPGLISGGEQIQGTRPLPPLAPDQFGPPAPGQGAPGIPVASVPAPAPVVNNIVINNNPVTNAQFTGVAGAPTDIAKAGAMIAGAQKQGLQRGNDAILRQAGVPR